YKTGLDWNTVIEKETKAGLNLISKNKINGWKSYEPGAYNFSTDSFIVFDGTTWVTASKDAVEYYMDPRNFLTQNSIFQFEALEYQPEYQIQSGVESILKNTPMYNMSFNYIDEIASAEKTCTYSQAFMDAAVQSGVSPYHLASRAKQEVVRSAAIFSDSVTGTVSGYEGYYNFYNIGATHSTAMGGAVANGLNFATGSTMASELARANYILPWNNRYNAIVGGAKYIGTNYINRGQNTIYLQKFNVTPMYTYTHQYMANVEAAVSEAAKTYSAYNGMGLLENILVFNIPIYENMPEQKEEIPGIVKNPNNWLKTLKIGEYNLTPVFNTTDGGTIAYTLQIEDSNITEVPLTAVAVNSTATIQIELKQNQINTGIMVNASGKIPLVIGNNEVKIRVTAENQSINTYVITIIKVK
ncbi:MAG: cadherin-like beta sandwich domain-containing protein, partial [Acetivibrio sp.]